MHRYYCLQFLRQQDHQLLMASARCLAAYSLLAGPSKTRQQHGVEQQSATESHHFHYLDQQYKGIVRWRSHQDKHKAAVLQALASPDRRKLAEHTESAESQLGLHLHVQPFRGRQIDLLCQILKPAVERFVIETHNGYVIKPISLTCKTSGREPSPAVIHAGSVSPRPLPLAIQNLIFLEVREFQAGEIDLREFFEKKKSGFFCPLH